MYTRPLREAAEARQPRARAARWKSIAACLALALLQAAPPCRAAPEARATRKAARPGEPARDRELASRFAPAFYQGLGDHRRGDYLTNFDFDGDWRGDNNWAHADDPRFPLRAYVYYAVSETATHYFIHYAVFHPRDYKGGGLRGPLLSEAIKEGVRRGGKYDPTGLSAEAVLAHENDMEGCLVVVERHGADPRSAKVLLVETLSHDRFLKYAAEGSPLSGFGQVAVDGQRPQLYIEPKGHGVSAYDPARKQAPQGGLLLYHFTGAAGNPEEASGGRVGYDLLPLLTTLWPRARGGVNETYGAARTFRLPGVTVRRAGKGQSRMVNINAGSAFLGKVGAPNKARPPWGWADRGEKGSLPGEWFFDPARTVRRHFGLGDDFGAEYLHAPFLGVTRK